MNRRSFLLSASVAAGLPAAAAPNTLPEIALGNKRVTRLIVGGNPIGGYAHSTKRLSELMYGYFTVERTRDLVLRCEQAGITTWQSHYEPKVRDALRAARERGSKIQWICLTSDKEGNLSDALALQPLAVVHHGGVTDNLIRNGQQTKIHDFVKRVKDAGVLAGVSSHNPDNVARVEDSAWENDFYMTCFFNLTRSQEELQAIVKDRILDEFYIEGDRVRMAQRIREVKKPCLAFKILAAGRYCNSDASVDHAFRFAFSNVKATDGVIVGMYPVISDEVGKDVELARKYGAAKT